MSNLTAQEVNLLKKDENFVSAREKLDVKEAEIAKKYISDYNGKDVEEYLKKEHATVTIVPVEAFSEKMDALNPDSFSYSDDGKTVEVVVYDELGKKIVNEVHNSSEYNNFQETARKAVEKASAEVKAEKEYAEIVQKHDPSYDGKTDASQYVRDHHITVENVPLKEFEEGKYDYDSYDTDYETGTVKISKEDEVAKAIKEDMFKGPAYQEFQRILGEQANEDVIRNYKNQSLLTKGVDRLKKTFGMQESSRKGK